MKRFQRMILQQMIRRENLTNIDRVLAQKYASDFSIPIELAQIVAKRFPKYSEARVFLFPEVKYFYNPETIPDIELATDEILKSLNKREGILIYCHDDPDGYTSAAIMYKTLNDLRRADNESIFVYPVIREKDGYILNPDVLRDYKQKGVNLIVTVDFGISSGENFRIAKDQGLKLVVCDHHEIKSTNFSVPAVDPKRPDSKYPFRELAGVGVSFKLAQSLYQKAFNLNPDEFYNLKKEFFPLVLVGTISDRVVLREENRIFCYHGIQIFNRIDTPWIRYFRKGGEIGITRITGEIIPTISSAAYIKPKYGVDILLSQDENYVFDTIAKLKGIITKRRQGAELLFKETLSAANIFPKLVVSIIPYSGERYLGAVSARLRDYYKRTSTVIGIKNGKCYGELRSNDIDLYEMLHSFRQFFLDFGGHRKAAGFTMLQQNLDRFVDGVQIYISDCEEAISNEQSVSNNLPVAFLDKSNVNILKPLTPFGEGNPPPVLTDGVSVYTIDNRFNIIDKE